MSKRTDVLQLAVLGLLHDSPMHGYELRKRLNVLLGWGRAFSYGTLYPCLKDLLARGWIAEDSGGEPGGLTGRRAKIVYKLTPEGKEHFAALLTEAGPASWEDEQFGVHLAFFGRTDAAVRLRILEGRRTRLQERLEIFRTSLHRARERLDSYTLALQTHGLESVEREVRWLDELIEAERAGHTEPANTEPANTESANTESAKLDGANTVHPPPATSADPAAEERR